MLRVIKIYRWKGITNDKTSCEGDDFSRNKDQLRLNLQRQKIFITNIHTRWVIRFGKPIKKQDIFLLTRQIARLLQAGIPLLQILELLEITVSNTVLKEYLQKIIRDLEDGFSVVKYFKKINLILIIFIVV